MEDTPQKATGIPRMSRLPRPPSTTPKPNSSIPRPTSIIRPSPSRDSLLGASGVTGGSELKLPKLRSSISRDQLRAGSSNGPARNPRLRASASRDQLNLAGNRRTSGSVTPGASRSTGPAATPSRASVTPSRRPNTNVQASPTFEEPQLEADEFLFKRRLTLTRRPSESFSVSSFQDQLDGTSQAEVGTLDNVPQDIKPRPLRTRPSLSERTMETLANIPSSPALTKKKSSLFFDQGQPRPRANSRTSRPGSSYNSEGSGRASSRATSRPGSSGGQEDPKPAGFRASAIMAPLSTIDGTPNRSPVKQAVKTPTLRKTASRPSLSSASKLSSPNPVRSPSPTKKSYGMLPPKSGANTMTARSSKPRTSVNGLFKKPSLPAMDLAAEISDESRATSLNSATTSWDGAIPSASSTTPSGTHPTTDAAEGATSSARKSSAALRDQIAKAKAAKRAAALRQSSVTLDAPPENETPIVPSDDGFDFGMAHDDPFNLRRGESSSKKVLQQRIGTARTSGRLNIAALGLKQIPLEVMKMYDLESIGANDGSWAESVDLTRFIAADNELERLDDDMFPDTTPDSFADDDSRQGNFFGGLETLDLHGNLLVGVPLGFRRLTQLTSLNLSSNRLVNDCLESIGQMTALRDLKLAKNLFFGPLRAELSNLTALEILDLQGNNISALPTDIHNMTRLRILNVNENNIDFLPFQELSRLPLTELLARKNKLSGTLIEDPIESLLQLQTLDVSANQLTRLVPLGSAISLPELHVLSLSMNRLQGLPDMTSWSNLLTLTVDENSISGIPNSFTTLEKLRHADFSSNDIRVVPPEISRMTNLSMIRLSGNPLRDKKFVSITTDELKDLLATRLEPPPPYQEPAVTSQPAIPDFLLDTKVDPNANGSRNSPSKKDDPGDDSRSDMDDDFATPPTSAPHSPSRSRSQTVSSLRSRSHTLSNQIWPVKQGGLLDRSRTESSTLHPVVCSKVASEHQVRQVHLQHNLFSSIPNSLSFFAETLATLSLASNQLVGETYLSEDLEFPTLKELNLSSNRMTGLESLTNHLHAPMLEKLDVSVNRINALPPTLKEKFPALSILLVANNQMVDLDPETIKGLKIVDASSNDISRLNPRLGLLGGPGGLERLDVMGNRFRVPRWNVLERGTEATLRWLRGRVPVAEMAAWKGDDDDTFADVD